MTGTASSGGGGGGDVVDVCYNYTYRRVPSADSLFYAHSGIVRSVFYS